MFVCVARVTLQVQDSGSLKARRQVVRRVVDRVKARFNVSVAEVGQPDASHRAELAFSLVGNDGRHVNEQMDKVLAFVEQMYVAPVVARELEILALGDHLYGGPDSATQAAIERHLSTKLQPSGRSLAEAEGLGDWDERHGEEPKPAPPRRGAGTLTPDEARVRARALRNRRDWEKP